MSDSPAHNVTQAVPFFRVEDMAASLRFYVDGLGFQVKTTWTPDSPERVRWCWLELGAAALMLEEDKRTEARAPKSSHGLAVSVCFMCRDALAIYREATARGLHPRRPFVGNRLWVVGFTDPDDIHIDFESPTDLPEDTEYDPAVHGM